MNTDPERSRGARAAAERALVRVGHHYAATPEFVLLGGLVPELLCVGSTFRHAGTTDIDVQVDLEIAKGSVQTARLEQALLNAEFVPAKDRVWRWRSTEDGVRAEVKFELLADLDTERGGATVTFDECEHLGAVNLRGTGYAARDYEVRTLRARIGGAPLTADIRVAGIAGFLLAKVAAAQSRRKPKDWYDIAFVLLHNDHGGVGEASERVTATFGGELAALGPALEDLEANFADVTAQGASAYASQIIVDHPEVERATAAAESVLAVEEFCSALTRR